MTRTTRFAWFIVLSGLVIALTVGQMGCKRQTVSATRATPEVPLEKPDKPPPRNGPHVDERLVAADTRFGLALFRKLSEARRDKNLFISPLSIAQALQMTYNGAAGETKQAMEATLELHGVGADQLNGGNRDLLAGLKAGGPELTIGIANSVWVGKGYQLKPSFADATSSAYNAKIDTVAFASPDAASAINRWVSDSTAGRIHDIVSTGELASRQIVLALLCAAYFKGQWTMPFDASLTDWASFSLPGGGTKTVPMMSQTGEYPYVERDGYQILSLEYMPRWYSMIVVLPGRDSTLEALCQSLTPEVWAAWMDGLWVGRGTIKLPRFRMDDELRLKDALTELGMGVAFDRDKADFSAMTRRKVWIDDVKQRAFVQVDEKGTEATTAAYVGMAGGPPPRPFEMTVDRPFLCAIRDNITGMILFLGAVVEPK